MIWKLNFITIWVLNLITKFWAEDREINKFVDVKTLDDQERHLTLEMMTLEMAHTRRERGKHTYKITSRQSLSN
jgi:hypothetical protein